MGANFSKFLLELRKQSPVQHSSPQLLLHCGQQTVTVTSLQIPAGEVGDCAHDSHSVVRVNLSRFPVGPTLVVENKKFVSIASLDSTESLSLPESAFPNSTAASSL